MGALTASDAPTAVLTASDGLLAALGAFTAPGDGSGVPAPALLDEAGGVITDEARGELDVES